MCLSLLCHALEWVDFQELLCHLFWSPGAQQYKCSWSQSQVFKRCPLCGIHESAGFFISSWEPRAGADLSVSAGTPRSLGQGRPASFSCAMGEPGSRLACWLQWNCGGNQDMRVLLALTRLWEHVEAGQPSQLQQGFKGAWGQLQAHWLQQGDREPWARVIM